jgi:butyryl-CoA dehydrogenase
MSIQAAPHTVKRVSGGSFLVEELRPSDIFTLEDLSPEQKQIAQMAADFVQERILPQSSEIEAKGFDLTRQLMRDLGSLGLLGLDVPEEYGGFSLDKVTSALVCQQIGMQGSFSVTFGAHSTIGTLPLVWYGNAQQKERYLPKLASGELIAAYALSEASAGSDAMNIRTRATLSPDGLHYVLNGEKMWISNSGFADLFTVFAKIDGERFSAFLVEKGTPGFTVGPEEHKLGIRGSSTCPLIFADCRVPAENLLGQAGKGYQIAFNVLNVGRYKIAASVIGGAQLGFRHAVRYGKGRIAFGRPITSFGLIQQKIADCAAAIYAAEAMSYRVIGAIDVALAELDSRSPTYTQEVQKRIEEFALECSILKIYGSEMLDRVVDDVMQIHGGYSYVEDYPIERMYRDSRINRIFEGTNEINRLIITNWMTRLSRQGTLALEPAIEKVLGELVNESTAAEEYAGPLGDERTLATKARKIFLYCADSALKKFKGDFSDQQEVAGALAEIVTELLALDSCILRTEKMESRLAPLPIKLTKYYAARSFGIIATSAERIMGAIAEGDELRAKMMVLRRLADHTPSNTVILGREISTAMVESGSYRLSA